MVQTWSLNPAGMEALDISRDVNAGRHRLNQPRHRRLPSSQICIGFQLEDFHSGVIRMQKASASIRAPTGRRRGRRFLPRSLVSLLKPGTLESGALERSLPGLNGRVAVASGEVGGGVGAGLQPPGTPNETPSVSPGGLGGGGGGAAAPAVNHSPNAALRFSRGINRRRRS